jgi:hypothetical protein
LSAGLDTSAISDEAGRVPLVADKDLDKRLAERLDQVDLLIADLGQVSEFTSKAVKFAEEATTEIRWNRIARLFTLFVVLAIISGLGRMLWLLMGDAAFQKLRDNPVAFSTGMAAIIGGGVVLATSVSRSVFSGFSERNGGMPMPEHLKAIMDGIGSIFGNR